jgi:type VI secretion system protein ImpH
VATESRRPDPPLADVLFAEGHRFEFFQAVRLLERLYPEREPVGREARPAREAARFRAALSLGFPASAVHAVAPEVDGAPPTVTVAFMGLTGPLGVLPRHYTALLLARVREKDEALRDFLDLLTHRLVSLFHRAWEKHRFFVEWERAARRGGAIDRFSQYLFDLIGLGTPGLRGRLPFPDAPLLFYAGLLAQQPRSASALAGLLADHLGVPVRVVQLVGEWLPLAEESRTRLGGAAANNALGASAVAGSRVWDPQAKFRLRLGPLGFAAFEDLLPSGRAYARLLALTRFVVGEALSFDVQLVLAAPEVPPCRLGAGEAGAARLGWSSWLKSRDFAHDPEDVILEGRTAA